MDYPKQMDSLQKEILIKSELAKLLVMNLKKEAKRFLTLMAKYNSLKNGQGLLSKQKDINFGDMEEYCNLVSRQFSGRIEEFSDKVTKFKLQVQRINNDVKARPTEDHKERIDRVKGTLKDFDDELQAIWKQEHFLVLNYRLDISAKELQRWSAVMQSNRFNEEKVRESIDNLFK